LRQRKRSRRALRGAEVLAEAGGDKPEVGGDLALLLEQRLGVAARHSLLFGLDARGQVRALDGGQALRRVAPGRLGGRAQLARQRELLTQRRRRAR